MQSIIFTGPECYAIFEKSLGRKSWESCWPSLEVEGAFDSPLKLSERQVE
jgi:hypothetical protein